MPSLELDAMITETQPIGAFATGNYCCECRDCKRHFVGDKRAQQCLRCAVAGIERAAMERVARAECRECRNGDKPRYDADLKHFYHDTEAGELGCSASIVRKMQADVSASWNGAS
jgi:hypothetical protein